MKAFDRFEIGGRLARGHATGRSVRPENAVPAAFKTVRSKGKTSGEIPGAAVEIRRLAPDSGAGHGELGADEKAIGCRAGNSKQLPMEGVELQFLAFGVFGPRNEKAAAARVVGIGEEAEPVEVGDRHVAFSQVAEKFVEVGSVVEGAALDENGHVGEGIAAFGEMVEVGMGFAADIGERDGIGETGTFIINSHGQFPRHAAEPGEVFGVAGYDEFDTGRRRVHFHSSSREEGTRRSRFCGDWGGLAGRSPLPSEVKRVAARVMVLAWYRRC